MGTAGPKASSSCVFLQEVGGVGQLCLCGALKHWRGEREALQIIQIGWVRGRLGLRLWQEQRRVRVSSSKQLWEKIKGENVDREGAGRIEEEEEEEVGGSRRHGREKINT